MLEARMRGSSEDDSLMSSVTANLATGVWGGVSEKSTYLILGGRESHFPEWIFMIFQPRRQWQLLEAAQDHWRLFSQEGF